MRLSPQSMRCECTSRNDTEAWLVASKRLSSRNLSPVLSLLRHYFAQLLNSLPPCALLPQQLFPFLNH